MENSDFFEAWPTVVIAPTLDAWRTAARELIGQKIPPERVLWQEVGEMQDTLFAEGAPPFHLKTSSLPQATFSVPRDFFDMARAVAAHRDPRRWAVLYGLLWRIAQGERELLLKATDPAVRQVETWRKAVSREIHKMHAFVRFRAVSEEEDRFVAWFEPEFRILRLAVPFFVKRFSAMQWSILTPEECAHWDGEICHYTPGVRREDAPDGDSLDALWRTYYRHIFNPARLKIKAMQTEMPQKFWKNLPEAQEIQSLIRGSAGEVQRMMEAPARAPRLRRRREKQE